MVMWRNLLAPVLVFAGIGALYLHQVSPYSDFHDSLSYLLSANQGFRFETGATAHFLYINLLHLQYLILGNLLPQALAHNLLSVAFSLGTLVLTYRTTRLLGVGQAAGLAAVVLLAVAYTFWSLSMYTEAVAMNGFLFMGYTYFALKDLVLGESRRHTIVAVFLALGLLTHIQNILALPFFAWHLYVRRPSWPMVAASLGIVAAAFAVLFVPFLLWRPEGVEVVFFDRQFRSRVLAMRPEVWIRGSTLGVAYFVYNFGIFVPVVILGAIVGIRRRLPAMLPLAILFVPFFVFALRYDIPDVYDFHFIPYIILAIVSAYGFRELFRWMDDRGRGRWAWVVTISIFLLQPAFYTLALAQAPRVAYFDRYDEPKAYKGGLTYYLWPGRRQAPDPLATALQLHEIGDEVAICDAQEEWYYEHALRYLERQGVIDQVALPEACQDVR